MLALGRCEKEKVEGKGKQAARGGKEEWAVPESGEGGRKPFSFYFFILCSILLKGFFSKIILN